MALTVEQAPFIVLDADYRIVEVGPAAEAAFGPLLGENVWTSFPDSKPLFQPHYERARCTGAPAEFAQYYNGNVMHLRVVPRGTRLVIYYEILCLLDVLTLGGLRDSIDTALAAVAGAEEELRRDYIRRTLHVVADSR